MFLTTSLTDPFSQYDSLGKYTYIWCYFAGLSGAITGVIIGVKYLHWSTTWFVIKFRPKDGKAISQVIWMMVGAIFGWCAFIGLALSFFCKNVEAITVFRFWP
jgi:hypothetical protein